MTTLSQIVQDLMRETRRGDVIPELGSYVNQVVREVHATASGNAPLMFDANLVELELVTIAEGTHVWKIPSQHNFQSVHAVFYTDSGCYAEGIKPSRNMTTGKQETWYRTGDSIAFIGAGDIGSTIQVAYFAFPRGLSYYALGNAPATWNIETQAFEYHADYVGDEDNAESLVTNWLLSRHGELIKQGVRAKIYARLGDRDRAGSAYSMYMGMRPHMELIESMTRQVTYG